MSTYHSCGGRPFLLLLLLSLELCPVPLLPLLLLLPQSCFFLLLLLLPQSLCLLLLLRARVHSSGRQFVGQRLAKGGLQLSGEKSERRYSPFSPSLSLSLSSLARSSARSLSLSLRRVSVSRSIFSLAHCSASWNKEPKDKLRAKPTQKTLQGAKK